MLRGHPWREITTPHTVQYVLLLGVLFGLGVDLIALVFVGLSVWSGAGYGSFLFTLGQWFALMVPLSIGWLFWHERRMLMQHYRARAQRRSLEHSEFDT